MSSQPRGRTWSPFARGFSNGRRFGVSPSQLKELDKTIVVHDSTADQVRGQFPDMPVHYGDKETLEESRFPWLKRRRRW